METTNRSSSVEEKTFSRRGFVKGSGSLIVGLSLAGGIAGESLASAGAVAAAGPWPQPPTDMVDTFLEIRADGSVLAKVGKGTAAQGLLTSIQQLYAEELDVPMSSITMKAGDSFLTPNQVGASGSNGMRTEWVTVRQAAATARQHLLGLASTKLGVPVSSLSVTDGVVSGGGKGISYGELIGGQTFGLAIDAKAPQKDVSAFKVIGTSPQRTEIPKIVTGTYDYIGDVRLPGMLHARNVRPPVPGAELVSVDGPHNLPGVVKVVAKGNYLAVVAKTEWQAIQASKTLKVTWREPSGGVFPSGYDELYGYMRSTTPQSTSVKTKVGDAAGALKSAAKVISQTYESGFQSHASIAGACAVADYRDGTCVVYFGGQKPYGPTQTISDLLGIPPENVRSIWYPGPGSYGRNDADDAGLEAAYLSQQVGAPVRVQWMRDEATGWDPKSPAASITIEAGLDSNNKVVSWNWNSSFMSGSQVAAGSTKKGDTLIGNLMGYPTNSRDEFGFDSQSYGFPNMLATGHIVPWDQAFATGLRTAHFRDPNGPQTTFASEQMIDEIAASLGMDPIDFRLTYLTDPRDVRIVQAVKAASNWVSRPGPRATSPQATVVSGRGIAYQQRSGTVNATVAEVNVNRKTGQVKVTKFTHAQDAGFVVNPGAITGTINANLIMSMSRALHEDVRFTANAIKSVDWVTYPIAEIGDIPATNVVLVGQDGIGPDGTFIAPSGAGEPSTRPTAAAIANAVFDATGVRVRRQPMTQETVLAALKAAGKAA